MHCREERTGQEARRAEALRGLIRRSQGRDVGGGGDELSAGLGVDWGVVADGPGQCVFHRRAVYDVLKEEGGRQTVAHRLIVVLVHSNGLLDLGKKVRAACVPRDSNRNFHK